MNPPMPAHCPRCQAALPSDSPQGLCPRCLAAVNFATETAFTHDEPPPPAEAPLSPAELAPHFPQLEILEFLGRGGMGVVYRARQKSLGRFVALKILAPERVRDPRFADRFAREAQALARLNHPSIVTIHDFGVAGGFFFLLMEYVDGVNLRQLLRSRRLSPEEALAIVPPLCEALQYAHVRGIVHRDIKPENLLLDREGRVKIADFGIARMLGAEDVTTGLAETQPAGTPGYMAPEQRSAPTTVDSRADIYSLGVVLYEMLTGEAPGTPFQPPSRRIHIDVRLDEIVLRALEQSPELRFQTAAELRTEVESAVAARRPSTDMPPVPSRYSSPQWVAAAIGLVSMYALLILGVTALAVTHGRFNRSTAHFAIACLAVACGMGVSSWISKWLVADAGKRIDARWPRRMAILSLVLWLPVLGFGTVFAIESARSSGGWHPGLGESVIVPLSWCGMFALPWAGGVLWHAGRPGLVPRPHGSWWRIVGGTFAALLLVAVVAWSLFRATQARQSAEMATRQAMIAEQRAQAAEEFGADVTALPLRGRLVDQDGNPMPNMQLWIVSPSYQPDGRNVPIRKQLMTDAQGRFQTEVLNGRSWQVMRPDFPKQDGPRSRAITVRSTGEAAVAGVNIEVRDDGKELRVEVLHGPVE